MTITDPASFLSDIDQDHLEKCLRSKGAGYSSIKLQYFEPGQQKSGLTTMADAGPTPTSPSKEQGSPVANGNGHDQGAEQPRVISGKVQTLGDFIDTDALAPAEALVGNGTPEELGQYCLYHTHPDFRRRVKVDGMDIVVAGKAFGVGSSRENAVTALQGAGVRCVIARSFAFIYARNQPNLGMLGIIMEDEDFYARAQDGVGIRVDVDRRVITLDEQEYPFTLSELEVRLWQQGGMARAFGKLGKGILEMMTAAKPGSTGQTLEKSSVETSLEW